MQNRQLLVFKGRWRFVEHHDNAAQDDAPGKLKDSTKQKRIACCLNVDRRSFRTKLMYD